MLYEINVRSSQNARNFIFCWTSELESYLIGWGPCGSIITDRGTGSRGTRSSSRSEALAEEIRLRRPSTEAYTTRRQPRLDRLPDSYDSNDHPFYSSKCVWFHRMILKMSSSLCHFLKCCVIHSASDWLLNRFTVFLNKIPHLEEQPLSKTSHRQTVNSLRK